LFGDNRELDLAGLNVEDGIGRIALREKRLLLFVIRRRSSFADFGQKHFGIEGSPQRSFHTTDFLHTHYTTAGARKLPQTATTIQRLALDHIWSLDCTRSKARCPFQSRSPDAPAAMDEAEALGS
jgi:hypothetical protein